MTLQLPIIQQPTHVVTLPSCGEEITVRPFVTKEEKILLMASLSNDSKDYIRAISQIVNNCTLTWSDSVKSVNDLTLFDLEWVMLQLRIHSIGDIVSIHFRGIKESDCEECKKDITFELDLKTIKSTQPEADKVVMLDDVHGVTLKYLTVKDQEKILKVARSKGNIDQENMETEDLENIVDDIFTSISYSIDTIFSNENLVKVTDDDRESIKAWVEELPKSAFENIEKFIVSVPTLSHEIELVCPTCEKKQTHKFEGLDSFFD